MFEAHNKRNRRFNVESLKSNPNPLSICLNPLRLNSSVVSFFSPQKQQYIPFVSALSPSVQFCTTIRLALCYCIKHVRQIYHSFIVI
eukprot:UN20165